ncbi:MAG TPA: PAS domain S-box protein [Gemmatimonadaceae bacterium]|nr:PAS domain S-box protein [Gemmatimonadaceae bacterium]
MAERSPLSGPPRDAARTYDEQSPNAGAVLAALVAASDDAIVAKTLDGIIRIWNTGAERLLGWTSAEAIGCSIAMIIPPDRLGEEAEVIRRISAGEHIHHYETVRLRKDGGLVHVSLSVSPVRDASGRVTMAAKFMRDITAQREREAERERRLEAEQLARTEAERVQALLEEQALELESQAVELEATIDEMRMTNEELEHERERRESARAETERARRMLDTVLDQLPVGIFVAEAPSGQVLLRNRKGDELLAYPTHGATNVSAFASLQAERLDGTPLPLDERPLARALTAHETVEQMEMRYRHADGSSVELSVSAAPIRDADGRVIMAVSTFLDVTARRAAEQNAAERQAVLQGFFGAPGLMIFVVELIDSPAARDYRIVFANRQASEWLGADASALVGRLGSSLGMSAAALDGQLRLYEEVSASKRPVTLEMPSAARAGSWLRMSVSSIEGLAGEPPRVGIIMVDVTEEHAREEQRQRLQHLVEHATDFIGVATLGLELEYVNPAGLALVGMPLLDAVRGRSAADLFDLESKIRLELEIIPTLREKGRWFGESVLRRADTAQAIPVELTVFAIKDPGSGVPVAYAAVGRGIGERQRLQAELRQAQKMEAVGQLAGGVAHDFNNLLSIILSYSMLVAENMSENDPARADVEEIRLAGERAASLTRQLLAFSRQQVLQPQVVDLNEIVASTEKMLRRLIGEDMEMRVEPAQDLGDVLVDPGQIEQVIMNLVVNARDAMPNGGKITIETANVELDEAFVADYEGLKAGPHVMLAVSDTGEGMSAETRSHLFEPFFTTKGPGKGTGLGLSTVFGILKQSGGVIRVYSEPGSGTSMKVYLPRTDRAGPQSPPPSTQDVERRGGNETILLVEDEGQVRAVAATILRRYGYHVLEAQSGGDALLICEQHAATIHLLLTDVIMQRISGPTLADRLALMRPEMRVLFMSGYTDRAVINHALLNSNVDFIQKPFTPERLAGKVRAVLDSRRRA